jgi:hypothetical protein
VANLRRLGADVTPVSFDGGHELAPGFLDVAAETLARVANASKLKTEN